LKAGGDTPLLRLRGSQPQNEPSNLLGSSARRSLLSFYLYSIESLRTCDLSFVETSEFFKVSETTRSEAQNAALQKWSQSRRQPVRRVLFDSDADQLTASPHSRFPEQFLNHGFHGALRDVHPPCNFLIRQAFENSSQHCALTLGKWTCPFHGLISGLLAGEKCLERLLIQPDFTGMDAFNCSY